MRITEVRVKLLSGYDGDEKLRGFCSITFDDEYVVRDIKIIEGIRGLFVAMPSRRVTARCNKCSNKNHLRARFCNECGVAFKNPNGRSQGPSASRLFVDIAHPINQGMRQLVHDSIMGAFREEVDRCRQQNNDDRSPITEKPSAQDGSENHDQTMEADR